MWAPFVRQCIEMVRDHEHNYVRGPGFQRDHDGTVTEKCASLPSRFSLSRSRRVETPSFPTSICAGPWLCTCRLPDAPCGRHQRAFRRLPVLRRYMRPFHLHRCPPGSTAGTGRWTRARPWGGGQQAAPPHGNRGRHLPHGS